ARGLSRQACVGVHARRPPLRGCTGADHVLTPAAGPPLPNPLLRKRRRGDRNGPERNRRERNGEERATQGSHGGGQSPPPSRTPVPERSVALPRAATGARGAKGREAPDAPLLERCEAPDAPLFKKRYVVDPDVEDGRGG